MKKAYIFFADGFEEVEGLTVVDILRRGQIDIKTVSITSSKNVISSHGIKLETDMVFDEVKEEADMYILPGGMPGTKYLGDHEGLGNMLKNANEDGKYLAAICAAPTVFAKYGFTDGKNATSYPGMESEMTGANYSFDKVVVDGNIITSRGLGTAILFAGTLLELLKGTKIKEEVLESIVYEDK
ncbi:MAG: DJ-1/PfpI family protein [Anaerostipes sp.]|jgi:4-methyl-5(b-hydroxyethyl)-thiazole monophosphate biosynthesis|nr:DJ-1/PfpI family protein [Anaerostipes sp.]